VEVLNNNHAGAGVNFTLHQMSDMSSNASRGVLPEIISESVLKGIYRSRSRQALSNQTIYRYRDITFPFRIILTFNGNETAEIQLNEPGDYDITINIAQ
jgi:hypothetical protein